MKGLYGPHPNCRATSKRGWTKTHNTSQQIVSSTVERHKNYASTTAGDLFWGLRESLVSVIPIEVNLVYFATAKCTLMNIVI